MASKTPGGWPPEAFPAGARVRIIKDPDWDGPWRQEFVGTVDDMEPPWLVEHELAHEGELAYWVTFDEPQHDCSPDGPYRKAQVWARHLRPAVEP